MKNFFSTLVVLSIAVLGGFDASKGDDGSYCVANPSFELANDDGGASDWLGDSSFVVSSEDARSGDSCLRWSGETSNNALLMQTVGVEPGDIVEFSARIKTLDLVGGRASICLEWGRQDGSWLGGEFAEGVDGTTDGWIKVSGWTRVPEEAANPHVAVYVTGASSGTALFDDVEIKRYRLRLFTAMTTDRYRNRSIGGTVDVYVGYTRTIKGVDFKALAPELTIVGENGDAARAELVEATDDYYRFSFDSSGLAVGDYALTCSTIDPNTKELETISTPFAKLDKFPERVSYVDENLRLIHNGEPFFPLGLYLTVATSREIDLIRDSAFNCVMPYEPFGRETVDALFDAGIYTIYSVKENYPTLAVATMEEGNARVETIVDAVKDAPGVLAWYINDELPPTAFDDLKARRDQMEKLDPSRPTWSVLYQVDELRSYLPTFDVVGSDPYPIPKREPVMAAEWTKDTVKAVFGKRAVWQVPQIFNQASYKKTESEKKEYRAPTYEEIRCMAWLCVANGANGLVFFSFFDLLNMDKTLEEGGTALVRDPFEERWADVKRMAREISDQFPILLSAGETLDVRPTETSSRDASYRLYGSDEGTWLLVVNASREPCRAEFVVPKDAEIVETRLGSSATQDGRLVRVEPGGLEPRLVLIRRR